MDEMQNPTPPPVENQPTAPETTPPRKPFYKSKIIWTALIIFAVFLGYYYYSLGHGLWPFDFNKPIATLTPTPSPSTSPIPDTSEWKTYTNNQYGFEFKYPPTWKTSIDSGDIIVNSPVELAETPFVVVVADKSLEDLKKSAPSTLLLIPAQVDNNSAFEYKGCSDCRTVFFTHIGKSYEIFVYYPVDHPEALQILSTFKFIEPIK